METSLDLGGVRECKHFFLCAQLSKLTGTFYSGTFVPGDTSEARKSNKIAACMCVWASGGRNHFPDRTAGVGYCRQWALPNRGPRALQEWQA